jgi:DNA-binding XRE family transcriptional regulator
MNKQTNIRALRERAGLLQVEAASRAGIGVATLNKAERWNFPLSPQTAAKLAPVLGCKPDDLLNR